MTADLVESFRGADVDSLSRERLAAKGLEYRTVAVDDVAAAKAWAQSERRGFLGGEANGDELAGSLVLMAERRLTGVFDPSTPEPDRPVATIGSWVSELSVPGGAVVPSCAVSDVTVAPTHRRRGIARAMLEGELRTAAGLGIPIAMLTVSESTLYGRYGFAAAASSAALVLDSKRATWTGPIPEGRVDFVSPQRWRELVPDIHDRIRGGRPGEVLVPGALWDRFAGLLPGTKDAERLRAIQYRDGSGAVRGLALYTVTENHDDFARSRVDVTRIDAATDDAYAAIWRFVIELDLIAEVHASVLSADEPVLWMIDDRRAATVTVQDHQYLRILDVPAALAARRYTAGGTVVLEVDDPLGLTGGRYTLAVGDDGVADVEVGATTDADAVRLGIRELSAVHLGQVPVATLARAGRVHAADPDAATRLFSWPIAPQLSLWY